ncbi:MAG TPA: DUF6421 family protein [Solirubrobacteraceae bacterium]|nr:DUF6421 family protein [Solirubrobacteraceae bacterium]
MPQLAPIATVLVDEAHAQAWTIRRDVAREMQPSHPGDSSYADAADALRRRGFAVAAHVAGPLTGAVLQDADVLVLPHASDPRWERVVPGGGPALADAELDAIERFVRDGGGLVVLGECEQEKYGNRFNDLLGRFGFRLANDTVSDYERHHAAPHWILADLDPSTARDGILGRVAAACFYRATTIDGLPAGARVLARASASSSTPGGALLAVAEHGKGRVAVLADSDLFGDDCLGDFDHEALLGDLVHWAARHGFARAPVPSPSAAAADPAWTALRDAADELRLLQERDGALTADADRGRAGELADAMAGAIEALAPRFPHQADHLAATVADLRAWAAAGFGVPDFTASLDRFRPDLHRVDGIEHLVVFPMYKQNGPRDKTYEALIVRVPWPDWLAELERTRYDNPKFVPVTLVDHTAGYDSECAVLFPETVSIAGRPANHFGAIFCDREAERFRRVTGAAAELLSLDLPADAAALVASERLSQDAYELWDLVHDRAHSHGDLPFDPFMIRQRMPYWMYSLEELRCDLTAFVEAMALEREGFAFARHVQYAILFDRLFRFPVTGTRVRNYDGLGGQLLFAYLHRNGHLHWTDNRLSIEWSTLADGVAGLRAEVLELYKSGIDRSKLAQWGAAHDLVAAYVPPATGSAWASDARDLPEVEDPRAYIDLVKDDEFPLSMFYTQLKAKLAPALERPARDRRPAPVAA